MCHSCLVYLRNTAAFAIMNVLTSDEYNAVQQKVLSKLLSGNEIALGMANRNLTGVRDLINTHNLIPTMFEKTQKAALFEVFFLMYLTFLTHDLGIAIEFINNISVFQTYLDELANDTEQNEPEAMTVNA